MIPWVNRIWLLASSQTWHRGIFNFSVSKPCHWEVDWKQLVQRGNVMLPLDRWAGIHLGRGRTWFLLWHRAMSVHEQATPAAWHMEMWQWSRPPTLNQKGIYDFFFHHLCAVKTANKNHQDATWQNLKIFTYRHETCHNVLDECKSFCICAHCNISHFYLVLNKRSIYLCAVSSAEFSA